MQQIQLCWEKLQSHTKLAGHLKNLSSESTRAFSKVSLFYFSKSWAKRESTADNWWLTRSVRRKAVSTVSWVLSIQNQHLHTNKMRLSPTCTKMPLTYWIPQMSKHTYNIQKEKTHRSVVDPVISEQCVFPCWSFPWPALHATSSLV